MNQIKCGGEFEKLLYTYKILDENTIRIETICRFCRGKSITYINTKTQEEKNEYISKRDHNFTFYKG